MSTNTSHNLVIVIPCYNEEKRLPVTQFKQFCTQQNSVLICFVNDGSKDNTQQVLEALEKEFPNKIKALQLAKNVGKAEAVRQGMLFCNKEYTFSKIAYLDADLATSLEECMRVSSFVNTTNTFAFGSRIAKVDNNIKRKFYRFFIGRVIATCISAQLKLRVYDTQCGCKVFNNAIIAEVFKDAFISKWLFDVEIFHRLIQKYGRENIAIISKEIPLKAWLDTDDSRVEFSYMFKLWFDLLAIGKQYKK